MTWLLARLAVWERRICIAVAPFLSPALSFLAICRRNLPLLDVLQPLGELGLVGGRLGNGLDCGIALWRALAALVNWVEAS